jgi:hypothetical protein
MLLGGEGNGEINELFIKEVMKKYEWYIRCSE